MKLSEPLIIRRTTRLTNSRDGNPRYILHTSHGDYRTEPDASINYGVPHATGFGPAVMRLELTGPRDTVIGIVRVSDGYRY